MQITPNHKSLEPETRGKMNLKEAQGKLAEIVQKLEEEDQPTILVKDGKAVAAVISIEAFYFLEQIIEAREDEIDLKDCQKILAETQPEDYIPYEIEILGECEIPMFNYSSEELREELGL